MIFTNLGLQLLYPLFEPLLIFTSVGCSRPPLLEAAGPSQSRLEAAGSSQSRLEAVVLGGADVLFICGRWGGPRCRDLVSGPAPASFPAGGAERAQPLLQLGYSPLWCRKKTLIKSIVKTVLSTHPRKRNCEILERDFLAEIIRVADPDPH